MGKFLVTADKYFNNQNKMDMIYGDMVCPVDINDAYVAEKKGKYGMDKTNGEYAEENIRERFGLETPEQGEKSY